MLNKNKKNTIAKTVFVGLSGGVDSSVSAYLLKKQGYKVVGVFIKTWQPDFVACTWKEERRDAMRVAAHLDIPFITLDLEKEYKEGVAEYMIEEYKKGRTPNPDVMCNKEVKFGAFLSFALNHGADFIATGHYARVREFKIENLEFKNNFQNSKFKIQNFNLLKAKDMEKEQSYFLWTLTQDQLSKILFPIGHLNKPQVRKLAKQAGLHTFEKKDSQGICFIGKISMKEFLSHYITKKSGDVLNISGEKIGHHDGAVFLTIGERHGFTITKKTPNDSPYYVLSKDIQKNTILVTNTTKSLEVLESKKYQIENINWISSVPVDGKYYDAQIRYHQKYQKCKIEFISEKTFIIFDEPQTGASGQSIVLYENDVCLGGGVVV